MGAIPNVSVSVQDGGLGIISGTPENVYVAIGTATAGPTDTVTPISDLATLLSTFTSGPLVEEVALVLTTAAEAGIPVTALCVRAPSTAGTSSAVTQVGAGASVMTVAGNPTDEEDVIVTIVTGGTEGTAGAVMTYSLDGGNTTSAPIAIPTGGTYLIPGTGVTLTFAAGSFIAGNTYSFTSSAPTYSNSDLVTAMAAVIAYNAQFRLVHIIGPAANVAGAASMQATMDTQMASLAAVAKWARCIIECPQDTDANILAAFTTYSTSKRVAVACGFATTTSPISGQQRSRSIGWAATARAIATPLHEDLGRVKSGPIQFVSAISRDEAATPDLATAGFITTRTIVGLSNFYFTSGALRSQPGSDFVDLQHGFVMDEACNLSYLSGLQFLNDTVRVNPSTASPPGAIYEVDAQAIENFIEQQTTPVLCGGDNPYGQQDASAFTASVDRTANVLSTSTIPVTIRVTPLGYDHFISENIGFVNPSLSAS